MSAECEVLTSAEENVYTCTVCQLTFKRKCLLEKHRLTHLKFFKCDRCETILSNRGELLEHMKTHKVKFHCTECNLEFNGKVEYLGHFKCHKPQHKCADCDIEFAFKYELMNHIKTHKDGYSCLQCQESFKRKSNLWMHLRSVHNISSRPNLRNPFVRRVMHLRRKDATNSFTTTTLDKCKGLDFDSFFNSVKNDIENEMAYQFFEKHSYKFCVTLKVMFHNTAQDGCAKRHFNSETEIIRTHQNIPDCVGNVYSTLKNALENFVNHNLNLKLQNEFQMYMYFARCFDLSE